MPWQMRFTRRRGGDEEAGMVLRPFSLGRWEVAPEQNYLTSRASPIYDSSMFPGGQIATKSLWSYTCVSAGVLLGRQKG